MTEPMNPPPVATNDDKIWIILCHLSLFLGVGILFPLIVWLVKKDDAPATAEHAKEALNFHISIYVYAFIGGLLCLVLIGIPLLCLLGVAVLILPIVASLKAADGQLYRYPLTFRLIK